jgi:hypothetical protein
MVLKNMKSLQALKWKWFTIYCLNSLTASVRYITAPLVLHCYKHMKAV